MGRATGNPLQGISAITRGRLSTERAALRRERRRSYSSFSGAIVGEAGSDHSHNEIRAVRDASEQGISNSKAPDQPANGARHRRRPLTDEEKAERRRQERELVKKSVEQLRSSEGWQAWLSSRSHFHRYSLSNQLLIAIQRPTATRVASLKRWRQVGYTVTKGERGIRIWAPCPPSQVAIQRWKDEGADPSEEPRTFFKLVPVFAQDQVDALPPPAEPIPLQPPVVDVEGEDLAGLLEPLRALATEIGFSVEVEQDIPRGAKGYCAPTEHKIGIGAEMSGNGQVKTLVHELAHALVRADHKEDDPKMSYSQEELVVESVAMSVCGGLGLDTSGYSIPYLTSWSEGADIEFLEQVAGLTNRLANRIEAAVG